LSQVPKKIKENHVEVRDLPKYSSTNDFCITVTGGDLCWCGQTALQENLMLSLVFLFSKCMKLYSEYGPNGFYNLLQTN